MWRRNPQKKPRSLARHALACVRRLPVSLPIYGGAGGIAIGNGFVAIGIVFIAISNGRIAISNRFRDVGGDEGVLVFLTDESHLDELVHRSTDFGFGYFNLVFHLLEGAGPFALRLGVVHYVAVHGAEVEISRPQHAYCLLMVNRCKIVLWHGLQHRDAWLILRLVRFL